VTGTADLLHPLSSEEQLDALVAGRSAVLDRIIVAARRAEVGALLLVGSLGRGGGDGWSDLDLIAVPAPGYSGLDLVTVFADKVLASLDAPRNAPLGGDYRGVCLDVAGMALWVDWYVWPQSTAVVPADATAIYDDLGLLESGLDFIPLINAHNDPAARAHPANSVTLLLRIAVAAKYLARADLTRLIAKLPEVQGLSTTEVAERLHSKLDGISDTDLADAVATTRRLVVLAAASARHHPPTDAHAIKENPVPGLVAGLAYGTAAIADHQSGWAQDAATEIARLRTALGDHAKAIEHIGSTAVPGLAAKPIIDSVSSSNHMPTQPASPTSSPATGFWTEGKNSMPADTSSSPNQRPVSVACTCMSWPPPTLNGRNTFRSVTPSVTGPISPPNISNSNTTSPFGTLTTELPTQPRRPSS
jgi:hypothetical protein